jgi:hypothetical protein
LIGFRIFLIASELQGYSYFVSGLEQNRIFEVCGGKQLVIKPVEGERDL